MNKIRKEFLRLKMQTADLKLADINCDLTEIVKVLKNIRGIEIMHSSVRYACAAGR